MKTLSIVVAVVALAQLGGTSSHARQSCGYYCQQCRDNYTYYPIWQTQCRWDSIMKSNMCGQVQVGSNPVYTGRSCWKSYCCR